MKRITIVLLTTVYLLSAIGVSASSFYCCGILRSTTLSIGEVKAADSKAAIADNCCKHTKQTFKVKDNHFGSVSLSFLAQFFPAVISEHIFVPVDKAILVAYTAFDSHAPPFRPNEPIYILNCTYRI